jgi:hypoxanthine phosphoribosyltransferase
VSVRSEAAIRVLIDAPAIARRVREIAGEIRRDHERDAPLHFVGVLKGAVVFLADLLRAYGEPATCDFVTLSSYQSGQTSTGSVRVVTDVSGDLNGRDVVIVEDIVDTGRTLRALRETLQARHPRSLRTAALLSKPSRREIDVPVEYLGFAIADHFVVGYGLDLDERHRELPFIGILDEAVRA